MASGEVAIDLFNIQRTDVLPRKRKPYSFSIGKLLIQPVPSDTSS